MNKKKKQIADIAIICPGIQFVFDNYKMRERKKGVIAFVFAFLVLGLRGLRFRGLSFSYQPIHITHIKKEISILTIL